MRPDDRFLPSKLYTTHKIVIRARDVYIPYMKRKFLKFAPTPGDEFEMLLFVLMQEVSFARLHLKIARGIAGAAADKPDILHCA